jgi:hypothetical protein
MFSHCILLEHPEEESRTYLHLQLFFSKSYHTGTPSVSCVCGILKKKKKKVQNELDTQVLRVLKQQL